MVDLEDNPTLSPSLQVGQYPRLFVLAAFAPEGGYGGGVVVRNMLEDYPAEKLMFYRQHPHYYPISNSWRPEIPRKTYPFRVAGRRFKIVDHFWQKFGYRLEARTNAWAASLAARSFGAQAIWAIMDLKTLHALDRFMDICPIPIHLSVHDDPIIFSKFRNYHWRSTEIDEVFARCLRRARSCDCISERLSKHYQEKYQVEPFVLTRGVDLRDHDRSLVTRSFQDRISIVLSGHLYCPAPWPQNLLEALAIMRNDKNLPVELHVTGDSFKHVGKFVFSHGMVPEVKYEELLRKMDIGYASSPLTPSGRELAATSFHTKVVTYIGAGLPFLYHGPQDSTVGDLLQEYQCGVIVESQDSREIMAGFLKVIENYESMRQECCRAARECFDIALMRRKLLDALFRLAPSKGNRGHENV